MGEKRAYVSSIYYEATDPAIDTHLRLPTPLFSLALHSPDGNEPSL